MSGVVATFVGAAILVVRGPRGRSVRAVGPGPPPRSVSARGAAGGAAVRAAVAVWVRRRGRDMAPDRDLVAVVTEVVSALRAGADPGQAWAGALGHPIGGDGTPRLEDLTALLGDRSEGARAQAAMVVVAGRLAGVLGAPLAQVLERTAAGLAGAAEAEDDRRAALAGPRATARVLTWLPVLAVVLGAGVGADPVGVLLGGGVGTAALVCGVALVGIGRAWIARLVRVAARAGMAE